MLVEDQRYNCSRSLIVIADHYLNLETPFLRCNWSLEFVSIAQFTDYFLKVYSPAPATNADLIIVNAGLFWLFSESAELAADQQTQDDYREYASKCRRNLETVLSNLPFHTPATIDYVLAMSVAVSLLSPRRRLPSTDISKDYVLSTIRQVITCMELHHKCVPHVSSTRSSQRSCSPHGES